MRFVVDGARSADTAGLAEALRDSAALVVSVRRRALEPEALQAVKAHIEAGKPVIGIRTASHAFAPGGADAGRGASWREFDAEADADPNRREHRHADT